MIQYMWQDIFKRQKSKSNVDILRDIPIFKGLSEPHLKKVSRLFHLRNYQKGEVIFQEKEPGESMYVIKSGAVNIEKSINKKTTTLANLTEGSFFGEVSLVDDETRSAKAITTKPTELLGFFKSDLMNLVDRDPRLASFIFIQLSMVIGKRLRMQSEAMDLYG